MTFSNVGAAPSRSRLDSRGEIMPMRLNLSSDGGSDQSACEPEPEPEPVAVRTARVAAKIVEMGMFRAPVQKSPVLWTFVLLIPKEEFKAMDKQLLKTKHARCAYCTKCDQEIRHSGRNSYITRHMNRFHGDFMAAEKKRLAECVSNGEDSPIVSKTKKQAVCISPAEQKQFVERIALWIARSMRPISIVEDVGLRGIIQYVASLGGVVVEIPHRTKIRQVIRSLAQQRRSSLREQVQQDCEYFSITTDIWTDRSARSFMAFTLHYVDDNFVLHEWVLEVKAFPGKHDAERIAWELTAIMAEWNLPMSKCTMLVRDGGSNIVKASQLLALPNTSCIAHSIHLVVGGGLVRKPQAAASTTNDECTAAISPPLSCDVNAILETPSRRPIAEPNDVESDTQSRSELDAIEGGQEVLTALREQACTDVHAHIAKEKMSDNEALTACRKIVARFRAVAAYFHRSPKGKSRLGCVETEDGSETKGLILDCPTRWNSTWQMLERFAELQPRVEAFFNYVDTSEGRKEFGDFKNIERPTPADWFAAKCLVKLLEVFAVVSEKLGGDHYPTMTIAFPSLRVIRHDLRSEEIFDEVKRTEGSHPFIKPIIEMMQGVRRAMLELFEKRFKPLEESIMWVPLLDPRFAKMKFLTGEEKDTAMHCLALALKELIQASKPNKRASEPPTPMPRFLSPVQSSKRKQREVEDRMFGDDDSDEDDDASATISEDEMLADCKLEICTYLKVARKAGKKSNPLQWWQVNGRQFPKLRQLARKWLGCVATSVPSERAFSTSGNVVTAKRCALSESLVRDLVFIATNCL